MATVMAPAKPPLLDQTVPANPALPNMRVATGAPMMNATAANPAGNAGGSADTLNRLETNFAPAPAATPDPMLRTPQAAPTFAAGPSFTPQAASASPVGPAQASANQFNFSAFQPFSDAVMAEQRRTLDPQIAEQEAAFRQRMVNQGIQEGTPAFDAAFANFDRSRNDALSSARNQAMAQALAVQNQMFGQSFQNANLAQQANLANAANDLQAQALSQADRQFGANLGQRGSELFNAFNQQNAQLGENQRQFDAQFGFGQSRADMQDLMNLLGFGQQTTQANNQQLAQDQQRAGALFGLIPGLTPTQLDVMGPANAQLNAQANANRINQDQRNAMFQSIGQLGSAFMGIP